MNLDDLLKSIREESDSKGGKIDSGKFFQVKTFQNPLKGQRYQAPGLPSAPPVVVKPTVVKIDPKKIIPENGDVVSEELGDKLDELIKVIREDNKLEEESQKEDKKQLEAKKKKDREDRIESKKETKSFVLDLKKSTGKVGGFFDKLKKFLKLTLLSGLINGLYNFFTDPKNRDKIAATQEFLRNYWPVVLGALAYFFTPFGTLVNFVVGTVGKFLLRLGLLVAKNPILAAALGVAAGVYATGKMLGKDKVFENEVERQNILREALKESPSTKDLSPAERELLIQGSRLEDAGGGGTLNDMPNDLLDPLGLRQRFEGGGLSMGTDTVPAMLTPGEFIMSRGAVNMFGVDTMMAMNKAGGGTNRPKFGLVSGFSGGGFTRDVTKLLENYEALRLNAYPDPATGGEPITIGVGATRYPPGFRFGRSKVMLGDTITKEEAYMIKDYDVKRHTKIAKDRVGHEMWPKLPENVKFALISKAFNYGTVYDSTLRELDKGVESGDYSALAAHYRNVLAKHNKGINDWRRNDEAGIIESGKSNRSGMTFSTTLPAPPVTPPLMPSSSHFGTGFDSRDKELYGNTVPAGSFGISQQGREQAAANRAKQPVDNRFSGFDLDFIFKPIREFLGVDTPNVPTETRNFVLPAVDSPKQNQSSSQTNDVPNFSVVSGNKMRDLISMDLGISDLAGVS